jgi:hypothetical protein
VRIVPAGVHHAIRLRLVVDLVLLMDRQRIHIGAYEDIPARTIGGAAHQTGHACRVDAGADVLDTECFQPLPHEFRGLELLKPELGMLMKMPAIRDDARKDLVDIVRDL